MDNIFGIGLPELIVIMIIAGMVMGPERIAQSARSLGRLTARLRGVSQAFFRQMNAELDSVDQDGQLRSTAQELNQLRREMTELRGEIFSLASGTATDTRQVVRDVKREAQNAIMPPNLFTDTKPSSEPAQATANAGGGPVYRPPSLFDDDPSVPAPGPTAAVTLPRRVSVDDDPDE